jgi:hypothetical protein
MSYADVLKSGSADPHQVAAFSGVLTAHKQAAGDLATAGGSFDPRGTSLPGGGGMPRAFSTSPVIQNIQNPPTTTSVGPGTENININTGEKIQRTQGGSDVFDDGTGRQLPAGPHYEAYKTPSPHPNETPEQFRARNQQELQNAEAQQRIPSAQSLNVPNQPAVNQRRGRNRA